jgi:hypothetical protein
VTSQMASPSQNRDRWITATFTLALTHAAFLALVHARPGRIAILLWYGVPVLSALAAAVLLALAFLAVWRRRGLASHGMAGRGTDAPSARELSGLAALFLVVVSLVVFRTYPSSYDGMPSQVAFRLPLDGPITVAWGGPTPAVNYHAVIPDQRWAYDLLVTSNGRSYREDGSRLEHYYVYGRPVRAPADGTVHMVHDGEPERPIGHWQFVRTAGNHVVLEVAPSEFLFIAHMQPGSITVAPGDRVMAGHVLGLVGNTGNSSEPHVHLHLQDTPTQYLGEGIPFLFHGYRVSGVEMERGMPLGGRERRSRLRPGAFTGEVVEHVERGSAIASLLW